MEQFETKLRGIHAKKVEDIMMRTAKIYRSTSLNQRLEQDSNCPYRTHINHTYNRGACRSVRRKEKSDNITTYLRKFQIDRQNLNLAKRILNCSSQYDHRNFQKQWKRNQNFIKVRSNFKRNICNQEPKIIKFQPIRGKGTTLVTITLIKIQSNPIHLKPESIYQIKALVNHSSVSPTNPYFVLNQLKFQQMSFYVPREMKNKIISCKISEVKQFDSRGKIQLDLRKTQQQYKAQIKNGYGRVIGHALLKVSIQRHQQKQEKENNICSRQSCQLNPQQDQSLPGSTSSILCEKN